MCSRFKLKDHDYGGRKNIAYPQSVQSIHHVLPAAADISGAGHRLMIPVLVSKEMLTAAKVIARRNCSLNDRGDSDHYSSCRFFGATPRKHTEDVQ